ncbi:hypothetical protein bcgnr5390_11440 [Bacillus luti]|nr:hypothetical protein BC2903_29470 [Bacillus cereus]
MSKLEVVKSIGDILVVKVYATNEESRIFGDVYTDKSLLKETCENDGDVLQGYGVIDKKTKKVLDPFESWYDSVDEALSDIEKH